MGQIVGNFSDSTGNYGFIDTGGSFTQIDPPGTFFVVSGINDAGQIVGMFSVNGGNTHGFLCSDGDFHPNGRARANLWNAGLGY